MFEWLIAGSALTIGSLALVSYWLLKGQQVVEGKGELLGDRFSPERYEPMNRLLAPEDLDFLKGRAGISPEVLRRLKHERIRIFKLYLSELSGDFQYLHAQVRRLIADAPEEYADLVSVAMGQQVRFRLALAGVHFRLALHQAGIGQVDLSAVLEPVRALQQVVHQAV